VAEFPIPDDSMLSDTILVTGGAGFIGCNFVRAWLENKQDSIVNLGKRFDAAFRSGSSIRPRLPTTPSSPTSKLAFPLKVIKKSPMTAGAGHPVLSDRQDRRQGESCSTVRTRLTPVCS
jgi:hypothetical protein